jgi:YhcH/YjgK/YiaL family protein
MILGDLRHWEREKGTYAPVLQRAIEHVRGYDLTTLPPGKYMLEGDAMFMLAQDAQTKPKHERNAESHRKFVDIQLLVEGEERLGVSRLSQTCVVSEDKLEEADYALYSAVDVESDIVLMPGMFAVFFPADVHRPCCAVNEERAIRKVVVKIDLSLFA